jgi:hypothetical protein
VIVPVFIAIFATVLQGSVDHCQVRGGGSRRCGEGRLGCHHQQPISPPPLLLMHVCFLPHKGVLTAKSIDLLSRGNKKNNDKKVVGGPAGYL